MYTEFLYSILFFITNFTLCFIIFKLIITNKIKFLSFIIVKRSSDHKMHSYKIYQNAGFVVIGLFLILSLIMYYSFYEKINFNERISRPLIFFVSLSTLYLVSIYDFKKNLHPIFRLFIQIILVYLSLSLIEFPIIPLKYIPLKIQYLLVVIFWVYVINIVNFVDGLDGLVAVSSIGFFLNIIIFNLLFGITSINIYISGILLPLILAFLIFNKPKAKIFLNDVGSIPLGYIIGFCLLNTIQNGYWFFFISIFLYFIMDVTYTLLRKIKNGHYPWARLFDYLFLQPVLQGKKSHWYVLKFIFSYYFFMMIIIFIINLYELDSIYLFIYSLIASLIILKKFNQFNLKIN